MTDNSKFSMGLFSSNVKVWGLYLETKDHKKSWMVKRFKEKNPFDSSDKTLKLLKL